MRVRPPVRLPSRPFAVALVALAAFGACSSSNQGAELASTTVTAGANFETSPRADVVAGGDALDALAAAGTADAGPDSASSVVDRLPPTPPIPPTPGPDAPPPDLLALTPYFSGADRAPLRAALDQRELGKAVDLLDADAVATTSGSGPSMTPRALSTRFLAAWQGAELKPTPERAAALVALAEAWPLMADPALLRAAEVQHALGDDTTALALLAKVDAASLEGGEATSLGAEIADAAGKPDDARKSLEAAFKADPGRLPARALSLLEDLRRRGGDAEGAAAMQLERAIRFTPPVLADAQLDLKKVPAAARIRWARVLLDAGRLTDTRTVLQGLAAPGKPTEDRCAAWILLGRAYDRSKKDADAAQTQAWKAFERALKCTGDARGEATWLGGRNRLKNGDAKRALVLLRQHAKEFPKRSTADDALQLAADAEKRPKAANKARLKALARFPSGDQADEIAWELVGPALEKRQWKKVLAAIDEILAIVPGGPPGRHPGRYPYWRGRALWELGKKDDARKAWRETVTGNPLSWYALLAYSRLAAEDEPAARILLGTAPVAAPVAPPVPGVGTAPSAKPAAPSAATVPEHDHTVPAALWRDPHFRRAIEWARLAGPAEAGDSPLWPRVVAELEAVPEAVRGEDYAFFKMAVFELGGANPLAMRLARAEENAGRLAAPVGAEARRWRLAYPRPFAELVARWATERGLEPGWLWSIMRVESNFDPTAVSWANAYGLMQIILPTAKSLARDTAITATAEVLLQPAIAIELGTKYLARLLDRHKVYPLASAGYNAGGGAVAKWRKSFGDLPLDEFVEKIPYREANLYAKAATQTLARYKWLYEGTILTVPLDPPGAPGDPKGE